MDLLGRELDHGRLRITAMLGKGGFGSVWKAVQVGLNREVAVKVLLESLAMDESWLRRFHREGQAIALLDHPNIVKVYHSGSEGDLHYLVTNLLFGTLQQRLREEGALPPRDALKLASDVASALAYAHANGIIHRDIKPGNIMFDRAGNAVLTDFGLVRGTEFSQLTAADAFMGTPAYMSPEQISPRTFGPVDLRSDLYSFGCVLYQILSGKPPFTGDEPMQVVASHLHDAPPPLEAPGSPPILVQAVERLLAKKKEDRYDSATLLLKDLIAAGHEIGIELHPSKGSPVVTQVLDTGLSTGRGPGKASQAGSAGGTQGAAGDRTVLDGSGSSGAGTDALPHPGLQTFVVGSGEPRGGAGVGMATIHVADSGSGASGDHVSTERPRPRRRIGGRVALGIILAAGVVVLVTPVRRILFPGKPKADPNAAVVDTTKHADIPPDTTNPGPATPDTTHHEIVPTPAPAPLTYVEVRIRTEPPLPAGGVVTLDSVPIQARGASFTLPKLAVGSAHQLRLEAPDWFPATISVKPRVAGEEIVVRLKRKTGVLKVRILRGGEAISGAVRIVDSDGAPVRKTAGGSFSAFEEIRLPTGKYLVMLNDPLLSESVIGSKSLAVEIRADEPKLVEFQVR